MHRSRTPHINLNIHRCLQDAQHTHLPGSCVAATARGLFAGLVYLLCLRLIRVHPQPVASNLPLFNNVIATLLCMRFISYVQDDVVCDARRCPG